MCSTIQSPTSMPAAYQRPANEARVKPIPIQASHAPAHEAAAGAHRLGTLSLHNLLLAPHRLTFFAGTLMLVLVSLAWTWALGVPHVGLTVVTTLPPTTAHAFIFAAAYMPLFIAGFMYTAGPRWLQVPAPSAAQLRWPVRLHMTGIVLLLVGTAREPGIAAFGALLLAIAWTAIGVGFATLVRASRAADRLHARCVAAFWMVGISAALLFAAALGTHHLGAASLAAWLLLFASVVPITATVAHRVLPFFTSNAVTGGFPWRPNWVLALLLFAVAAFGTLQLGTRVGAFGARSQAWATLTLLGPGAIALGALALRWGLIQSLRSPSQRLLAMLHLAFAWLPLALVLACADAGLRLAAGEGAGLGLAPVHALTLGMLGSLLFAMATRVICGHGGIALVADKRVWRLFWLLQAAVLMRIAAPLDPGSALPLAASTLWTVVWIAWALRYLPVMLRLDAEKRAG
jgi:uncharacterized protein involved in response to NO